MTKQEVRQNLMDRYDADRVMIKEDGTVEVCSTMPNTNEHGWWYAGTLDEITRQIEAESTI